MGERTCHDSAHARGRPPGALDTPAPSAAPGGWEGCETTPVAGVPVHAAVLGPATAPEVVCVHGLGVSHRYFLPFARALAPRRRTVAVDLPGFGRTPGPRRGLDIPRLARSLAAWLRATGRAGVPLVANSIGCQITVHLAATAPELVGPLVLNGLMLESGNRGVAQKTGQLLLTVPSENPALVPLVLGDYLRCGPRRIWWTLRRALDDPVSRTLPKVAAPAVVVRGTHDRLSDHESAALAADLLPHGRLVEVPGKGHALNYSAPHTLARITEELVTGRP